MKAAALSTWFIRFVIAALFLLATVKFIRQDISVLRGGLNDFATPWVAAKALAAGADPYGSNVSTERIYDKSGMARATSCPSYSLALDVYPMAYPPPALLLLAPFTFLPWKAAVLFFSFVSIVILIAALVLVAYGRSLLAGTLVVGFGLAMAPVHSGIHQANPSTLVVGLLLGGSALLTCAPVLSGVLIGLAFCLKPQVAFLFLLFLWYRRSWRTVWASATTIAVVFAASFGWLALHHVSWLASYRAQMPAFAAANSFSDAGLGPFQLLNLQVVVWQITHNVAGANAIAWGVFFVLLILGGIRLVRRESAVATTLALLSVLTLMPVYQRYYTAALLVLVFAWAVDAWPHWRAKLAIALLLPLVAPLVAIGQKNLLIASHYSNSRFWQIVLWPHMIWLELALAGLLIGELWAMKSAPLVTTVPESRLATQEVK
jgi:hypothetical protein